MSSEQAKCYPYSKLDELLVKLKGYQVAVGVWGYPFDDDDREKMGGDLEKALQEHGSIVGIWHALRPQDSNALVVIECAYYAELISDEVKRGMLMRIAEDKANAQQPI